MEVRDIPQLTEDNAEEPLYNTVFDDINGVEELAKYARYDYVEKMLDSFETGPSSYLRKAYNPEIMEFPGTEKEFWINRIVQEAAFYLREIRKWISTGRRTDALIRVLEDLNQYPDVLDSTAYLLKGKARMVNKEPLLRLYLLQIGSEDDDPDWILLFEGIKFEYDIRSNSGIVATVYERTNLVIDKLKLL